MNAALRIAVLALSIFLTGLVVVSSQEEKKEPAPKLKTYYLALLRTGPHHDQDSATAARIQDDISRTSGS